MPRGPLSSDHPGTSNVMIFTHSVYVVDYGFDDRVRLPCDLLKVVGGEQSFYPRFLCQEAALPCCRIVVRGVNLGPPSLDRLLDHRDLDTRLLDAFRTGD